MLLYTTDPDNKQANQAWEMLHSSESVFVTGKAGTGKSTFLKYFVQNSSKKTVVLAPTGIAALHVGGQTVHSFFRFPFRPLLANDEELVSYKENDKRLKILRAMDVLVIDEVSMLRADLLDAIDTIMRVNLQPDLPFGGKQVLLVGDPFQLEPVITREEFSFFQEEYATPFFFSAKVFNERGVRLIELSKVYRQEDEDFIYLLDKIRTSEAQEEDLEELNKRYKADFKPKKDEFYIVLAAHNKVAEDENRMRLQENENPQQIFIGSLKGNFGTKNLPTDQVLHLKKDAQVLFVRNDIQRRWVNGTLGYIESMTDAAVVVRLPDGKTVEVQKVVWENQSYEWDPVKKKITSSVTGTFEQLPLRLAYSITIHKSQGLTFDKVIVDIGSGAFACGQLYVALSRCRTLEGLVLRTKIRARDVLVNRHVVEFSERFSRFI